MGLVPMSGRSDDEWGAKETRGLHCVWMGTTVLLKCMWAGYGRGVTYGFIHVRASPN
jgi:hypothetical protein